MTVRRSIRFDDELDQELRREAAQVGSTISALVCMKLLGYVRLGEIRELFRDVVREELRK
jgi:hypothetical protein